MYYHSKRLYFLLCIMAFGSCQESDDHALVIAASSNMQFALTELVESFEDQTNIPCNVILGSSGKLCNQILAGAPFDVFLSADLKYPELLKEKQLVAGEVSTYAYGKLILWSLHEDINVGLNVLLDSNITHIAIPNPEIAPYGKAAVEVLKRQDIYQQIKSKLVFGESVSQTNQYITSKSAYIGITSNAIVHADAWKNIGSWDTIAQNMYKPIAQGSIILLSRPQMLTKATRFQNFLKSKRRTTNFN